MNNQPTDAIVRGIITVVVIVVVAYLVNMISNRFLTSQSIAQCMRGSQTVVKNTDGSSWSGPNTGWYERCMKAQGLEAK